MKRIIVFILAISILVVSLVSCDIGPTETSDYTDPAIQDETPGEETTAEETAAEETPGEETTAEETSAEETPSEEIPDDDIIVRDPSKTYNILFIGNSFTYRNNMPTDIFKKICESSGYKVNVETITNGGHYLWEFASPNDTYGKQVHSALKEKQYDIVIIQEQSGNAIANPARFYDGVRDLSALVKENGAELWLFETWGYKEGYSKLPSHGGTTAAMEMMLRAAYTAIADEVGARVAYTGVAMIDVHTNNTQYNLYNADLYHPSKLGSTLAAFTLFAAVFNCDVREISYKKGLDTKTASIFKEAAYNATFGDNSVDEEYRTSSLGVTRK